jgi:hypothetical protein
MVSVPKIVGAVSCGFLLCLGLALSDVASSSETMSGMDSAKTIKGKVLRIEGDNYVVKNREDGKEVRLHVDRTTQMNAVGIRAEDNVLARVNDQNHVISILTDQSAATVQREKALQELESR